MESIGITNINIIDNISSEDKNKIDIIFKNVYNNSSFITQIDNKNYQGDMGCLCVLGTRIVRHLIKSNLLSYITNYDIINIKTNEKENMLIDG